MKKAVTISIAQTLFNIEEDAYLKLDQYLKSIRDHFHHTKGQLEIIQDIEARISEQFIETKRKIITMKEVDIVIESMGKVEDFDPESEDEDAEVLNSPEKKLYRNPKDKILAGVCSGFAVYFNIDPLWIRIGFLVFVIGTYGFGLILYIILAILIPEAKTTSQTLEMKGMPVTLETMSDNLKETVHAVRAKHGSTIKRALAWPFKILKSIIDFLMAYILPTIRVLIGLFIVVMTLGAIVAGSILTGLILTNGEVYIGLPINSILSTPIFYLTVISVYLAALIPLVALFILSISIIQKKNLMNMTLGLTFLFVWCAAVVGGGVGGVSTANSFELYTRNNPLFEQGTREIPLEDKEISQLDVTGRIDLKLIQGDEPKLTVTGAKRRIENLSIRQDDGYLYVYPDHFNFCFFCQEGDMEATLTLPDIESLSLYGGSRVDMPEWTSEKTFDIQVSSNSHGDLKIKAPQVIARVSGYSHLNMEVDTAKMIMNTMSRSDIELVGTSPQTEFLVQGGSNINALSVLIEKAKVEANNNSNIILGEVKYLEKIVESGSSVSHQGTPEIVDNSPPQEDHEEDWYQHDDEDEWDHDDSENDDVQEAQEESVMQDQEAQETEDGQNNPATTAEEGPVDTPADSENEAPLPENAPSSAEAQGTLRNPFSNP